MQNMTVSIRAKRIALVFQIIRIKQLKEKGIIDLEDDDYNAEDPFLD
jgi:hypothetical protein